MANVRPIAESFMDSLIVFFLYLVNAQVKWLTKIYCLPITLMYICEIWTSGQRRPTDDRPRSDFYIGVGLKRHDVNSRVVRFGLRSTVKLWFIRTPAFCARWPAPLITAGRGGNRYSPRRMLAV